MMNFALSNNWTPGGIDFAGTISVEPPGREMLLDDWLPTTINFRTCHGIPASGAITITVPTTDYADFGTTCKILGGVKGVPKGLETAIECARVSGRWVITSFLEVLPLTTI